MLLAIGGFIVYLKPIVGLPVLFGLLLLGLWLILHSNDAIQTNNTLDENYTFEQLNQGVDIYVPPAAAKEIPIHLSKGETTQIEIHSFETQNHSEHHIDSMVLNAHRKKVVGWDRSTSEGYGISIPTVKSSKTKGQPKIPEGRYALRLSNEYQTMLEKKIHVKVSRWPYSGNITVTSAIGTIRWS